MASDGIALLLSVALGWPVWRWVRPLSGVLAAGLVVALVAAAANAMLEPPGRGLALDLLAWSSQVGFLSLVWLAPALPGVRFARRGRDRSVRIVGAVLVGSGGLLMASAIYIGAILLVHAKTGICLFPGDGRVWQGQLVSCDLPPY